MMKHGIIEERTDLQAGAFRARIKDGRKQALDQDGEPFARIFATEHAEDNGRAALQYLADKLGIPAKVEKPETGPKA